MNAPAFQKGRKGKERKFDRGARKDGNTSKKYIAPCLSKLTSRLVAALDYLCGPIPEKAGRAFLENVPLLH